MGKITGASQNKFKSAEFLYAKIKRELRTFGSVNLIDDNDFPQYTADVLRMLGNSALKEQECMLILQYGKAPLPKDFTQLYAAYRAKCDLSTFIPNKLLQNTYVYTNDITRQVLKNGENCEFTCPTDTYTECITIKQYVNEGVLTNTYGNLQLLQLSPNAHQYCSDNALNIHTSNSNELTINNGEVSTNFEDDAIYLQYYAFPYDENNLPQIPDIIQVEQAIEAYIKWKILLGFWLTDSVANVMQKAQYYEQEFHRAFAEAKFIGKLPGFSTLVQSIRNARGINKLQAMKGFNNRHY